MYIDGLTCDNIGRVDLRLPTIPVPVTTTLKCTVKYVSQSILTGTCLSSLDSLGRFKGEL